MRRFLLCAMLCICWPAMTGATEMVLDFERISGLSVYPAKYADALHLDGKTGARFCRIVRNGTAGDLSTYTFFSIPERSGALEIAFRYRNRGVAKLGIQAVFRTAKGANGSAGKLVYDLPPSAQWRTFKIAPAIPGGAAAMQFIWLMSGGKGELELADVHISALVDQVPTGAQTVLLRGFYEINGGEPSQSDTTVEFAHDTENIRVKFYNAEPEMRFLKDNIRERDGAVWRDDCNSFFIYDPERRKGWQFAANLNGTQFDAELRQKVAGDPFAAHKEWNAAWQARAVREKDGWTLEMTIPFRALNIEPGRKNLLLVNFCRERKTVPENSQWNSYAGRFNDVEKFAVWTFANGGGTLSRTRVVGRTTFAVKRAKPLFSELLGGEKGQYVVGAWNHGYAASQFSAALQAMYSTGQWRQWQHDFLAAWGRAGMFGPALPWHLGMFTGGEKTSFELAEKYAMKFPYYLHSSDIYSRAMRKNPRFYRNNEVDSSSSEYSDAAQEAIVDFTSNKKIMILRSSILFVNGKDEPTNHVCEVYSRTNNPRCRAALERADLAVRQEFGYGRYGLADEFGEPSADTPYQRIAMWRWWNSNFAKMVARDAALLHKRLPGVPFLGVNNNTVCGVSMLDLVRVGKECDWISCDPYPTSTAALFGMERAIYHTGFSVKMLRDLVPDRRICVMPQAFVYHGRKPEPADMREWASQAVKSGATVFYWYCAGPSVGEMFDGYLEMLRLNNLIGRMNKVIIPEKTKTGIFWSESTVWGLNDAAAHSAYTVYSILGESLKSWFRFVSENAILDRTHKLDDFRLIYVPAMSIVDDGAVEKLFKFVRDGGTLVVLDPTAFARHPDGSPGLEKLREFARIELGGARKAAWLLYDGKKLPLAEIRHVRRPEAGSVMAFSFASYPEDAVVRATYPDGAAAMVECRIGKGTLIFSAVQPFGHSAYAVTPGVWEDFFRDNALRVGEKCGLPIWDFELPATGGEIKLTKPPMFR